ncbi:MFS transporter [Aciditerrimonas ferrireducens]|uniref:MFS transporter n=1 Tax=Aciditerrimonas ferrireducens TaxID=667306 RepID=UPI00249F35F9|nr:MFS transporter [Aciditerrimonas ferrireducens]
MSTTTTASPPAGQAPGGSTSGATHPDRYKWIALSNTTLGILMATINSSIMLIAMPDIFRGIHLNPLVPSNTSYLLWLLMGFMVVTAVLVVSFGRLGDMYGRVRMYNLGFVTFTFFSIMLSVTWLSGTTGALWLIVMRILQGVGGAFLMANSSAILTDAFPEDQRGLALGINNVAGIAGSFIGLILGGLLGPVNWHLVFIVSVPFGLFGTVWSYLKLEERGVRVPSTIDWWGNLTFAVGLVAVLVGITYGIIPYGHSTMGWSNPMVIGCLAGGVVVLILFGYIETKVANPMFRLPLFRIRAFAAGNFASLLASLGRGGMMFILIIWLQGIWLPLHGYSFSQTPLWAGIYMLPLTAGFLAAGPISGYLSDHFGARPFATGGMVAAAVSFLLLTFLPINFGYVWFALLLLLNGLAMGLFASPNRAGIMNSLPPNQRGAGAGMVATFQNSAMVLSIGIFFTLIITGLAARLPGEMFAGLVHQGVPASSAAKISHLPPTATVFAAFLGYNPIKNLLGGLLQKLPAQRAAYLTGRSFFPHLISHAFGNGLHEAFYFALAACAVAAVASWLRGGKYHYVEGAELGAKAAPAAASPSEPVTGPVPALVGASTEAGGNGHAGNGLGVLASTSTGASQTNGTNGTNGNGHRVSEPAPLGDLTSDRLHNVAHKLHNDHGGSATTSGTEPEPGGAGTVALATRAGTASRDTSEIPAGPHARVALPALVGRVVGADGEPIVSASVTVVDPEGREVARQASSDDGSFLLQGLPAGRHTVVVAASGFASQVSALELGSYRATLEVALRPSGVLSGSVRDVSATNGKSGVAGALVALVGAEGRVLARTTTDERGGFRFEELAAGDYTVAVTAPARAAAATTVVLAPGETREVAVALGPAGRLEGRVTFDGGRPLPGAPVRVLDAQGRELARSVSDAEGRYRIAEVPPGRVRVVVDGLGPASVEAEVGVSDEGALGVDLALPWQG